MRRFLLGCLLLSTATWGAAHPDASSRLITLGSGLTYVRLVHLPADLPTSSAAAERGAVILDLRGTQGNDSSSSALSAWVLSHAKPASPVFLLVNAETAGCYQDMVGNLSDSNLPFITLGPGDLGDTVDVPVNTSEDQDRLACEALAKGTPIETLTAPKVDKVRHDEAELDRDLKDGIRPGDESDDTSARDLTAPEPKQPLVDLVLARAIQLDHALVALRRLPHRRG